MVFGEQWRDLHGLQTALIRRLLEEAAQEVAPEITREIVKEVPKLVLKEVPVFKDKIVQNHTQQEVGSQPLASSCPPAAPPTWVKVRVRVRVRVRLP